MVAIDTNQQREPMARKALRWLRMVLIGAAIAVLAVMLTGCGTTASEPVGIGSGPDQLKESPCACTEIPQVPLV